MQLSSTQKTKNSIPEYGHSTHSSPDNRVDAPQQDQLLFAASLTKLAYYHESVAAQLALGDMYYIGQCGLPQKPLVAAYLYQEAHRQMSEYQIDGYLGKEYSIGLVYLDHAAKGIQPKSNYKKAFQWFQKAADLGDEPYAQYQLGLLYLEGNGTAISLEQACAYLEKASQAEHPHPQAKQKYADALHAKKISDLEQRCKSNDIEALTQLGARYFKGNGVKKNIGLARDYLTRAAIQHSYQAAVILGKLLCQETDDIPTENAIADIAEGCVWTAFAACHEHPSALDFIQQAEQAEHPIGTKMKKLVAEFKKLSPNVDMGELINRVRNSNGTFGDITVIVSGFAIS